MILIQAFLMRSRKTAERKTWTESFVRVISCFESLSIGRGNESPAPSLFVAQLVSPEGAM